MRPFTRVKTIKGQEYLYEVTPYYDPETKKVRQKSRYLGKNVQGTPVKVREAAQPPKRVVSCGEFLPFLSIIKELGLEDHLTGLFSRKEAWVLLTLAMNHGIHPRALRHVGSWYEGTILAEDHPDLPLSSQALSAFLGDIGERSLHHDLSRALVRDSPPGRTFLYDITSLSSYSKLIPLLEYGYNRDHLDLPQVNLALIVDPERGIPVLYDLYPGSIVDVSTLQATLQKVRSLGIEETALVMDRGFFSAANLDELVQSGYLFVLPASLSSKAVKQAIASVHAEIGEAEHLVMYHDEPLFVLPVSLTFGDHAVTGYVYYDQQREQEERKTFYRRLHGTITRLKAIHLRPWMRPGEVFEETARSYAPYLAWTVQENRFTISLRQNAISQRVNRMGKFLLLCRGEFGWEDCLALYRCKDLVEKGFSQLKNDLGALPLGVRKESTLRGYLFVCFLALLLRMRLLHRMKESGLSTHYSVEGVLTELEKLRIMILPNGTRIQTEQTKRQREILEGLGLCA